MGNNEYQLILIVLGVLSICIAGLLGWVFYLYRKINNFLAGTGATNLEDSIISIKTSIKDFEGFREELEAYLEGVEGRLKRSVQSIHTIRFNPFKGTGSGGNQSFATALLNEEGDGVIISSLYSRDHVSVFSKPVKNHASEYELSEEETQALREARGFIHKKPNK